jgi:peptide-methionine (S)-S-oxide reductase
MGLFSRLKAEMPSAEDALPGRAARMPVAERHFVLGTPLAPPFPEGMELALVGLGCFWGAEKSFWETPGVISTAVGYAGGLTPNPTYREVCTGRTGHAEVVRVVFDPARISYDELLRRFWEHHDPTQGMRQGNDVGTQYRSVIHAQDAAQRAAADASRDAYQAALASAGFGAITTEIVDAPPFYYAEAYHQQYLHKVAHGDEYRSHRGANPYCPDHGTGVACPVGLGVEAE